MRGSGASISARAASKVSCEIPAARASTRRFSSQEAKSFTLSSAWTLVTKKQQTLVIIRIRLLTDFILRPLYWEVGTTKRWLAPIEASAAYFIEFLPHV